MSGIYGFTYSADAYEYKDDVKRISTWNHMYGLDATSEYSATNIYMGMAHEKLSILSNGTFMYQDDKYVSTIDAIIYNRQELISTYGDTIDIDSSTSDEVILHKLLVINGTEALAKVNGDFAGAIYDIANRQITLFRDHMGVRPLFYYLDSHMLSYSTDIRGLTALSNINSQVSEEWVYNRMSGHEFPNVEKTAYEHIYQIAPAGYVTIDIGNNYSIVDKGNFWKSCSKKIRYATNADYIKELRSLITDAVNIRLAVIDGTVGAELSGGLDSSVIDILINRAGRKAEYVSWSMSPDEYALLAQDERQNLFDICNQEGITCNYISGNFDTIPYEMLHENMKKSGIILTEDRYKELFPYYVNTDCISGTAQFLSKKNVRVCFTGHGGDEGVSHRCNPYELFYHHEYLHYFRELLVREKGKNLAFLRATKKLLRLSREKEKLTSEFINSDNVDFLMLDTLASKYKNRMPHSFSFAYDPVAYIEDGYTTNRLLNVALQGAYNNVRYMAPYLDYRVIDYALSIPRYMYMHDGIDRYIFREAFKDILPESIYKHTAKEDFSFRIIDDIISKKQQVKLSEEQQHAAIENYINEIHHTLSQINVSNWSQYVDFDKLNAWADKFDPTDYHDEDAQIEHFIYDMAAIDQVVKRAKRIE